MLNSIWVQNTWACYAWHYWIRACGPLGCCNTKVVGFIERRNRPTWSGHMLGACQNKDLGSTNIRVSFEHSFHVDDTHGTFTHRSTSKLTATISTSVSASMDGTSKASLDTGAEVELTIDEARAKMVMLTMPTTDLVDNIESYSFSCSTISSQRRVG